MLKYNLLNFCSCPFLVCKQLGGTCHFKLQLRRGLSRMYPEKNSVYWMCNPQWRRHVPGVSGRSYCSIERAARFYVLPSSVFINSIVVKLEVCWSFILQFLLKFLPSVQKSVGMKMHLAASDVAHRPVQVSMNKAGWKATWERVSVHQIEKRKKDVSLRPGRSQNSSSRNSRDMRG